MPRRYIFDRPLHTLHVIPRTDRPPVNAAPATSFDLRLALEDARNAREKRRLLEDVGRIERVPWLYAVYRVPRRLVVQEMELELGVLGPEPEPEPRDVFVLAAEVILVGGTPLIEHPVRVIDPDTLAVVADGLRTDAYGVVRTEVPENKTYRIEIVDRDLEDDAPPLARPAHALLLCQFVDQTGDPLAGRDVVLEDLTLVTDENGFIEASVHLGHYELEIEGQTFHAHAVLEDDRAVYRFVVTVDHEPADDPENRLHRLHDDEEELFA
jgi:hypothetical protein